MKLSESILTVMGIGMMAFAYSVLIDGNMFYACILGILSLIIFINARKSYLYRNGWKGFDATKFKSWWKKYWSEVVLVMGMMIAACFMLAGEGVTEINFSSVLAFVIIVLALCGMAVWAKALTNRIL